MVNQGSKVLHELECSYILAHKIFAVLFCKYIFSILFAHFLCNTIMPLFTNILNFQNDVYHFVTLLYKMTSHLAKMIIPGYFKTFYVAAVMEAEQSFNTKYFKPFFLLLSLYTISVMLLMLKYFSNLQLLRLNFSNFTANLFTL